MVLTEVTDQLIKEAGRLKATYRISLADSIAVAEAVLRSAPLVTSDHHEMSVLENNREVVCHWVR